MWDTDDWAPLATMADAHREWHLNAGVPMGQPGCPQDACHPVEDFDPDDWEDGVNRWADEPEDGPEIARAEAREAEGPDRDDWMAAQDRWERQQDDAWSRY